MLHGIVWMNESNTSHFLKNNNNDNNNNNNNDNNNNNNINNSNKNDKDEMRIVSNRIVENEVKI